jgi:hypothetical protein
MQKHLELESYDKETKRVVKKNLMYHTKNLESKGTSEVVAFSKSKWSIVRELTQKASN